MQLQPQLFSLSSLLSGRLFRIPEYQRAYSWEKKQRDDLFGDIERVRTSNEDHFMATIVGLTRGRKRIVADEFTLVEIVDGQQRLTTLIILLKGIYLALNRNNKTEKKLADELSELLVKGDDLNLLLLQTNHDLSDLFSDYIRDGAIPTADALTSADQNIIDAISESQAFVAGWKENGASYVDLIGIIRNRLWAIFHSVDDEGLVLMENTPALMRNQILGFLPAPFRERRPRLSYSRRVCSGLGDCLIARFIAASVMPSAARR
jgi:hypothetical protein